MTEHKPRAAEHVNNISHGCFGNNLEGEIQQQCTMYKESTYFIMKNGVSCNTICKL